MMRRSAGAFPRSCLASTAGLSVAVLPIGWASGYHRAGPYAFFWASSAALWLSADGFVRFWFAREAPLDRWIRTGVVAFALVVALALALGAAGRLTLPASLAVLAGFLLAARIAVCAVHPADAPRPSLPIPPVVAGLGAALVAFMVAFGLTHAPTTLYDSLSYHLYFAARWLQAQRLSIVPTPFSDVAQAYAPANGELFFLWLMLPFHGDLVARMGQLPFLFLGAGALFGIARRLGAPPAHAIYPACFFLLCRQLFEQAMGANVDLIFSALFLTSLYLGVVAVDRDLVRDWILWGVSLGLYLGTKYLGLVYLPVFLLLPLARGVKPKSLWAVPGVLAFGAPWYVRNWISAGSPIYPSSLEVAGVTIARGAFHRAAMINTVFHVTDPRLLPVVLAHAFGPTLFLFWLPFAAIGTVRGLRRGWWPYGFVLLVPALMVPLYWFGSPTNADSRFLLPVVGPALLPLAFVFGGGRAWNAAVSAAYLLGAVWILVGAHATLPVPVPWFMGGWLSLEGLVASPTVPFFLALAAVLSVTWWAAARRYNAGLFELSTLAGLVAVGLMVVGQRWCPPDGCESLHVTSPFVRQGLLGAWRWMDDHVDHASIAYTGINLPYPLFGPRLTNRVMYVNIDDHPRWRFDDYDRAYRDGRFTPQPPMLARSSGELREVPLRAGPRDDALRPRYERMTGSSEAWTANLRRFGITHLFVSSLSAYEIDEVWHDDGGFPIEDRWAGANPAEFQLLFSNGQAHVYALRAPGGTGL